MWFGCLLEGNCRSEKGIYIVARKDISDELVCLAYAEYLAMYRRGGRSLFPYEILAMWTGEPEKVCSSAMKRAFDRGYIEYGVSLRSGWLTEKGKALISLEIIDECTS